MKKWAVLSALLLFGFDSFSGPFIANFDRQGVVGVTEIPSGLLFDISLLAEPRQKYVIKLLPHCKVFSPYWARYRQSFEVHVVSDKDGRILSSTIFPGMYERDLRSRNLNSIAFYKLEGSNWRITKCIALEDR